MTFPNNYSKFGEPEPSTEFLSHNHPKVVLLWAADFQ